jgi:hypothetical protein
MGYSYDYAFRWIVIWSKVLRLEKSMRQRHVTLPLREDRADDDGEGGCGRASPHISRDRPTRWQLGSRQRRSFFCVMSRDQIIGMRELKRWPNNGALVMLTRAAIHAGPGGATGDKNNEARPAEAAQNHQGEASQDEGSPSRLRKNHSATTELRGPARLPATSSVERDKPGLSGSSGLSGWSGLSGLSGSTKLTRQTEQTRQTRPTRQTEQTT